MRASEFCGERRVFLPVYLSNSVPNGGVQSKGHSPTSPRSLEVAGGLTSPCDRAQRSRPVASGAGIPLRYGQGLPGAQLGRCLVTQEECASDPVSAFRPTFGLRSRPLVARSR